MPGSEPAYETIAYAVEDGVATTTLSRPDAMNAMTAAMRRELAHAFMRAGREARVLLVTGAPPADGARAAFCAGQDLGDIRESDLERILIEEYAPMLKALANAPIPTIAAVNGAAAGAGLHLALGADLTIAAESAKFTAPFSKIGLIPAGGGSYWTPRRAGLQRAMAMTLLGESVPAEIAERWGMIWRAYPDERLMEEARAMAVRLAKGPTEAFRLAKIALRASGDNTLDAQLALEAKLQGEAGRTRDYQEGVAAFLEKRAPNFEGR